MGRPALALNHNGPYEKGDAPRTPHPASRMTFDPVSTAALGLGLDAGGTQTRWALARADGSVVAEGQAAGFSGLQLTDATGREDIAQALRAVAGAAAGHGRIVAACAGVTGFDGDDSALLVAVMAQAFALEARRVRLFNDVELACRAAFAPGQGYLVYAGTGSIAAFVDEQQQLHRAGGRGGLIDDGGSGYWIAREALRRIWRAEDESPGLWRDSVLAKAVFDAVGGSDWAHTRGHVYGASRGQIGELALAVAAVAESDHAAKSILIDAGHELARLGAALVQRHGARPVRLAGRVFALHPCIEAALREAMPATSEITSPGELAPHHSAARMALKETAA